MRKKLIKTGSNQIPICAFHYSNKSKRYVSFEHGIRYTTNDKIARGIMHGMKRNVPVGQHKRWSRETNAHESIAL
jgi:hypothetical protein